MALIISNGSRTHIERSIIPPAPGGLVPFRTIITGIMAKFPFKDLQINNLAHTGDFECWGFKQGHFANLYRDITANDHLLLFENKWDGGRKIISPRVFYGKVTHKAINPAFAGALWGPGWHYVYFLTDVREMTGYTKENILLHSRCFTGPNWFRFKQQRFP